MPFTLPCGDMRGQSGIAPRLISGLDDNYISRNLILGFRKLTSDRLTAFFLMLFIMVVTLGVFGPMIAPYEAEQQFRDENGELQRGISPSVSHPLGTTIHGRDVLSRILIGARATLLVGLLGGGIIVSIGLIVGVTAGYIGGIVDTALMRITDIAYGTPVIPTSIVIFGLFDFGLISIIMILGFILWRNSARVIRSQVLQIKERPFIQSAKAMGASKRHIIFKHIVPNIMPMAFLFFALGIGSAIMIEASLSFLGLSDPFLPTWGLIIRRAYQNGAFTTNIWWVLAPGIMISITVLSAFMVGRGYESTTTSETVIDGE
jgi:peptide/nickel transport system permease protein